METLCKVTDQVRCKECGRVSLVEDLITIPGDTFYLAGVGETTTYYFCPCNLEKAKVFNRGRGDLLLVHEVELMTPQHVA